jgi:NADPH:quinone reductase-like Zn-dependent oxidoreductase
VRAVSLNYRDKVISEGTYLPELKLPFVPASDAAGVVVKAGKAVTRLRVGDRVIGHYRRKWLDGTPGREEIAACVGGPLPGLLSEYVVLPECGTVATPRYLSDCEAATLPIAALTAWFALVEDARIKPGYRVLTQGTGGVSIFSIQLAKALGAQVIATSSSDDKLERAKRLGAFAGVNYVQTPKWEATVLDLTEGRGVDCIIETTGGRSLQRSVDALAIGGHIAVIGFLESKAAEIDVVSLVRKRARIHAVAVGHRKAFEEMNRALDNLQIKPVIDTIYEFADVPLAFEHLGRGAFGKIVIRVRP